MTNYLTRNSFSLVCLLFILITTTASGYLKQESIEDKLKHANSLFWIGLEEKGNMKVSSEALRYLLDASQLLAKSELDSDLKVLLESEIKAIEKSPYLSNALLTSSHTSTPRNLSRIEQLQILDKIRALRQDISEQAEMVHDTFNGVFPLTRFMQTSLFQDAKANGTYELIDSPGIVATRSSASTLVEGIVDQYGEIPQVDVVFISEPHNPTLENETLYLFSRNPRLFVHNYKELREVLSDQELEAFNSGKLNEASLKKLFVAFKCKQLLLVNIKQLDQFDDQYMYLAEGKLFQENASPEGYENLLSAFGFARDRRDGLRPLITLNFALLFLAVLICQLLIWIRANSKACLKLIPVFILFFLVGRSFPWIAIPFMSTTMPEAEALAKLSFWWTLLMGFVLIVGPAMIYKVILDRLHNFFPSLRINGKGGAVFVAVSLGVSAYLAGPLILLNGSFWGVFIPLLLTVVVSNYILGRTIDTNDTYPRTMVVPVVVVSMVTGMAYFSMSSMGLCFTALLTVCILVFRELKDKTLVKNETRGQHSQEITKKEQFNSGPTSVNALKLALQEPLFSLKHDRADAMTQLEALCEKKKSPAIIKILGGAGQGKTAFIENFINKKRYTFLHGNCVLDSSPYEVFRAMFAGHFNIDLHIPDQIEGGLLEQGAEQIIPFLDMFLPPADEGSRQSSCLDEFNMSVFNILKNKIIRRGEHVVMVIDDYQWIDPASKELFDYLQKKISEEKIALTIILVSMVDIDCDGEIITLKTSKEFLMSILSYSLNMTENVASPVAETLVHGCDRDGGIRLLLQYINELISRELINWSEEENGFVWTSGYTGMELLTSICPKNFQDSVDRKIASLKDHEDLIKCAACIGYEFSSSTIANILEEPEFKIIKQLDGLGLEDGLFIDVMDGDTVYRFSSQTLLHAVREYFKIRLDHIGETPQFIRSMHKSIATYYEGRGVTDAEIAIQYFSAGKASAEKALHYCNKASRLLMNQYAFSGAAEFLDKAAICAKGRPVLLKEVALSSLKLKCEEAHIIGDMKKRQDVLTELKDYFKRHQDAAIKLFILAARAAYDLRDYTQTREFADVVVQRATQNSLEMAEGHHFQGLALDPKESRLEITTHLRTAYAILEKAENRDEKECLARIANSLAEILSYTDGQTNKEDAEKIFERSLEIKKEFNDKAGMARAYGGLGRLLYYSSDTTRLSEAESHFLNDLKLSEELGDLAGQTQMHSFLGGCSLKNNNYSEAYIHYCKSLELSVLTKNGISISYAVSGLCDCYKNLPPETQADAADLIKAHSGKDYLENIQGKVDALIT